MAFPTLDTVVKQLREIAEDDSITADSKITAIDVDSLDVLEWIFEIEEEAGFVIDEQLYSKASLATATVGDFYERVKNAPRRQLELDPDRSRAGLRARTGRSRTRSARSSTSAASARAGCPRQGAVLLACNHISLLDPLIVLWLGECTRRKVRFLAMAELWKTPVLRFFLEHTHQIPVDRASAGALGSLESAATALRAGECVAVFPEGEISTDLELMPGKTGVARLAASTGVPVTPMGVWGSQRVHAKGRKPKVPWGIAAVDRRRPTDRGRARRRRLRRHGPHHGRGRRVRRRRTRGLPAATRRRRRRVVGALTGERGDASRQAGTRPQPLELGSERFAPEVVGSTGLSREPRATRNQVYGCTRCATSAK